MRSGMRGTLEAIGRIYAGQGAGPADDFALLARYASTGDDRAFRALVDRHGRMVLATCRQITGNPHDADDAFQATFLILARKAGSLWPSGSLAGWLHRVARRAALEAVRRRDRHRQADLSRASVPPPGPSPSLDWLPALHAEIDRLPPKYRSPLILCDLEGLTRDEASRLLGWPPGTVAGRLSRARSLLRARLSRLGFSSASLATPVAPLLPESLAQAAVSAALHPSSAPVATTLLAQGVLTAMRLSFLRPALAFGSLASAGLLAAGLGLAGGPQAPPNAAPAVAASPPALTPSPRQTPLPRRLLVDRWPIAATPEEERPAFDVLVVDSETKRPIPGATLLAGLDPHSHWYTTGPDGLARGLRPGTVGYEVSIGAWSDDHQPKRMRWSNREGSDRKPLTPLVTFELAPGGMTVGGRVVDEKGAPIEGVTVELSGTQKGFEGFSTFNLITCTTGADGRWSYRAMPADLADLGPTFHHPDYLKPVYLYKGRQDLDQRFEGLKKQQDLVVMKPGRRLEGRVVDQEGRPVEGAVLKRIDRRPGGFMEARSDPDGRFVFPVGFEEEDRVAPVVLAITPGLAPGFLTLPKSGPIPAQTIRLGPGRAIQGRVVDESGQPLADAHILARETATHSLGEWIAVTDADGQFTWAGGPAEAVVVGAVRHDRREVSITLPPDRSEHVWELSPSHSIDLRVADARTGRPLHRFDIVRGRVAPDGSVSWPAEGHEAPEKEQLGRADVELMPNPPGWRLRITAQGYHPEETPILKLGQDPKRLDLKLTPLAFGEGGGPSGTVVDEAGQPIPGAFVLLSTPSQPGNIQNGDLSGVPSNPGRSGAGAVETDDQGRFTFSTTDGPYTVATAVPAGYGETDAADLAASGRLVIRPWGRVAGQVLSGSRPLAGARIHLNREKGTGSPTSPSFDHGGHTTDADGRFTIDRIPAGSFQASASSDSASLVRGFLEVLPGQETTFTLGGTSRPVVGRVVLEEGEEAKEVLVGIRSDRPAPPFPDGLPPGERAAWLMQWRSSPEGRAYNRSYVSTSARLAPDGSFRVDDLPEGDYLLTLNVQYRPVGPETRFSIPPMPTGRSDEPLDLGALRLSPAPEPR